MLGASWSIERVNRAKARPPCQTVGQNWPQMTYLWRQEVRIGRASRDEVLSCGQIASRAMMINRSGRLRALDLLSGSYRIRLHGGATAIHVEIDQLW
jgi:hypothetical protein